MPSNAKLARKAAAAAANNKCILCGKDNGEYGHNADPVAKGRCCEKCNITRVIPERMRITKASGVRAEYAPRGPGEAAAAKEWTADYEETRLEVKRIVDAAIMPKITMEINGYYAEKDAPILINRFREAAYEWFNTHTSWPNEFNCSLGKDSVSFLGKDDLILWKVWRDKESVSLLNLIKLRQKKNKDTYFHFSRPAGDGMWDQNDMMTRIMGIWQEQKRQGILVALKENNKDFVIDGKTYYTLTLTQIRPDKSTVEIGLDPYGVEMGFNIHGIIYWFVSEANRDAVIDYVMK
jgi:hypothetical protein